VGIDLALPKELAETRSPTMGIKGTVIGDITRDIIRLGIRMA
jgi:hypothetical protein